MKRLTSLHRAMVCLVTALALLLAGPAMATEKAGDTAAGKARTPVEKEVRSSSNRQVSKERAAIIKEAVDALAQTRKALDAIEKKKKQQALDALATVTGKLEIVLAREPALANAPIDVRVEQYDLYATVDAINKAVNKARDLLGDGRVQQARMILSGLASEIDIVVTSIPLASYTNGIKAVARLVGNDKYQEASDALYGLLSTLVVTRNIIPLPILRAEELLKKADKLAETKGRSDKQNKELASLLDGARDQIRMAEALGYGDRKEYKDFYRQIKEIRKKTQGGRFGKGFFDKLKKSLHDFREKIFNHTRKK
ncbi:MAG TPA: YfdX family protein [Desulfobulbus sp.]|nr:YfdX family protein [Desulfobulbus sp.]